MSSSKRERQLARERHLRQQAKAAEDAERRRTRQRWIAIGLAIVAGVALVWLLLSLFGDDDASTPDPAASATPTASPSPTEPTTAPAALECTDAPAARDPKQLPDGPIDLAIDPARGTWGWYLDTNCTVERPDPADATKKVKSNRITFAFDPEKAPKTVNSMLFLSDRNQWYDNSSCHRLTTEGIYVLQCGDPTLTGSGGPGYTTPIPDENLPTEGGVTYPAGTVAMANSGPNTNQSQFFIVYQDTTLPPNYTIFGKVTEGLDIVEAIAAAGVEGGGGDGKPAEPIGFSKVVGYITQEVAQ